MRGHKLYCELEDLPWEIQLKLAGLSELEYLEELSLLTFNKAKKEVEPTQLNNGKVYGLEILIPKTPRDSKGRFISKELYKRLNNIHFFHNTKTSPA